MRYEPNCGITMINGYVKDAAGQGLAGYRAHIATAIDGPPWATDSFATRSTPGDAFHDGLFEVALRTEAFAYRWFVHILDSQGNQVSARIEVETTATGCQPGGNGKQVVWLSFKRVG